jgi:hypothetical protein
MITNPENAFSVRSPITKTVSAPRSNRVPTTPTWGVVWRQVPYTNKELGQETVEVMSRFSYGTSTSVLSVLVLPPKSNSDRSAWMVVPESSGTNS